ncbi:DUF4132 domain-containing protein [Glycomyces sp. NRRL B-16210]|uniref:DUF4132 domain-containing protein n=1 Tax=Glycomyces sp. NRRL B-16210 TaxID=1463821 RepID=UPI0004C1F1C2|nr:DUF4132 domain-containing protein [Glycomyces sp. NRRL B-16210]
MNPNDTTLTVTEPLGEDRVVYPDEWRDQLLDRRGRGTPRPVAIDADAPERLRELFAENAERLEPVLAHIASPEQAAAVRDGLAGKADPFGAAVALALVRLGLEDRQKRIDDLGRDAWITMHGIAFAAQATVEYLSNEVRWDASPRFGDPYTRIRETGVGALPNSRRLVERAAPMRSILAALPEGRHAEARAALDASLSTDTHRFVAAILMPDQEDLVLAACRLHSGIRWSEHGSDPLWAVVSTPEHLELSGARLLYHRWNGTTRVPLVVDALGTASLGVFVNVLEHEDKPAAEIRDAIYDAIGRLPSDEAVAYLLRDLTNPQATAALSGAAQRFPTRTLRAVAAAAPTATAFARTRLARLVETVGLQGRDLAEADRTRLEDLLRSVRRHPVAETTPEVFTTPPWAPFGKAKKTVVEGLTPPPIDGLRWAEGEQEAWSAKRDNDYYWSRPDVWNRVMPSGPDHTHYWFPEFLAYADEALARSELHRWDGTVRYSTTDTIQAILARHGVDALARVEGLAKKKPSFREALMPIVNLEVARMAAGWLARSRADRAIARTWLDRHAAEAATLLVPDALAKAAGPRRTAADALRYLAAGDRALVLAQAAAYGETAAEAVEALLDLDPLDPQRPRVPKAGAWADPAQLPPVLLHGGEEALPAEAVAVLMSALALDDFERPYAGIDLLAAECDRASLAAFSWGLFELWLSAGSPSKDAWAMDQLGRFADEDGVRRLAALIRQWPGQSQSRKAVRGLEVLGAIGTEAALRQVQDISRNAKFKALKKTAVAQIEVIAERLELSLDELADRLVPDFGLASDRDPVLDYGPREFTVKFDERLRPFLIDEAGKRRASAPKPGAKDDPDLAQAAYERFAALRKDLKTAAAEQVKRLEGAMCAGRSWTLADFRRYLVDHPLVWQLSSRLVWQAETAEGRKSFRLAEDRSLADVDDEPYEAPGDATVRIAHPVTLGDEVEGWATVLADYEILQPFDQLARPVHTLSEEERKSGRLTRFEGPTVGAGPLVGLLKRGWQYGSPPGRKAGRGLYLVFAEGGHLHLEPSPGVYPGYDPGGDQTLEVEIALPDGAQVDPVVLSEAINVVARLTHVG